MSNKLPYYVAVTTSVTSYHTMPRSPHQKPVTILCRGQDISDQLPYYAAVTTSVTSYRTMSRYLPDDHKFYVQISI